MNAWSYESTLRTPHGMVIYGSHGYLIYVSALLLYPTIPPSISLPIYLSMYVSITGTATALRTTTEIISPFALQVPVGVGSKSLEARGGAIG